MKALIVVDMQNDFINGSLGTPEAAKIVSAVVRKIKEWNGPVLATRDTHTVHYLSTQEGRLLPVEHCIKGTRGWEIAPEVQAALNEKNARIIDKPAFGSLSLAEAVAAQEPDQIEVIGLCTDICVVSNVLILKARLPETPISVDSACCAGVTPAKHEAALETLRSCQTKVY